MARIKDFVKQEIVLIISFAAAFVSCFFVPPDGDYAGYIDFRTLALLYSLMVVVAGWRKAGTFAYLAHSLCIRAANTRVMAMILIGLSFLSSMLITNDVALLTFVPFAIVVLGMAHEEKEMIRVVVLQTVAANLGSMLTPVGNPQNLFIHSYYGLSMADFISYTLPVWIASLVLIALLCLTVPAEKMELFLGEWPLIHKRSVALYSVLFAICLLTVMRILAWQIMLAAVILVCAVYDRGILKKADFMLLLTFVFFFVFAGNLARIESVAQLLRKLMDGREYWVTLAASQVISNVPATLLLSGFTGNAKALLLGADIGGLGMPIASLASLISLKLYAHAEHADSGRFLAEFLVMNIALLAVLSLLAMVLIGS